MEYIGIHTQQKRNNVRTTMLLILFPVLVLALTYLFSFLLIAVTDDQAPFQSKWGMALDMFLPMAPYVFGGVLIWFLIAFFANGQVIRNATGAKPLERKENKRVYNLMENLCMSKGMAMPKVNIIEDDALNAYASGINNKTYTVTLTRGIINKLEDDELEAVIAHELMHIRNHDVRLLIVSIVFVGIFAMLAEVALRSLRYSRFTGSRDKKGGSAVIVLLVLLVAAIGYFFSTMMRFAISRNREYMADAGAAEMTKNPTALASALRKISGQPIVKGIDRDDVAQLFIEHPLKKSSSSGFSSLFATHPPIEKRIEVLEQF